MATARKCDRCRLYYDSYNDKNNAEKINGIMNLCHIISGKERKYGEKSIMIK